LAAPFSVSTLDRVDLPSSGIRSPTIPITALPARQTQAVTFARVVYFSATRGCPLVHMSSFERSLVAEK
jgi:hypothetical protein